MAFFSGRIEFDSAESYLLDGTKLGIEKNLRKLDPTKQNTPVMDFKETFFYFIHINPYF